MEINAATVAISAIAMTISLVSLLFAYHSWRQAHRPIVTARVTSAGSGYMSCPLNLMIENTGNRPACSIRIEADKEEVMAALSESSRVRIPDDVRQCLFGDVTIPVLGNGKSMTNAFGFLSKDENSTWCAGSRISLTLKYFDIDGKEFTTKMEILVNDDEGFAQTYWR